MEERRSSLMPVMVLGVVVTLPILYVLSIGPVARYYSIPDSPQWMIEFYSPVLWLRDNSEWFGAAYYWYMSLWDGV